MCMNLLHCAAVSAMGLALPGSSSHAHRCFFWCCEKRLASYLFGVSGAGVKSAVGEQITSFLLPRVKAT
jgi:hypothetical protein